MHKNALFKGRSTLVAMVTTAACSRPGASFSYKNVAKKEWNVYFSISSEIQYYKLVLLLVTLFVFTLIHSTFQTNETCKALKECYLMSNIPKRNLASACHLLKKLINLHAGGLLDVTSNIYLKSCAYHPDSECCTFFHGNLSDPKSSEHTLLYLYVI